VGNRGITPALTLPRRWQGGASGVSLLIWLLHPRLPVWFKRPFRQATSNESSSYQDSPLSGSRGDLLNGDRNKPNNDCGRLVRITHQG